MQHQPLLRPLAALSLLACACAAHAQSSITLYGVADASLRYTSGLDAANAASAGTAAAVSSGVNTTSRFGFRGSEDLGGGLRAVFNLESGVNIDTGASANTSKLFDRAAYVGVQTDAATLTLGRQTTVLADVVGQIDPLGSRFASFNPNVSIAGLSAHRLGIEYGPSGASTGAYRLDNSAKAVGRVGDFSLRAMHAFGEQAGSHGKLSSSGLGLGYQSGDYSAALGYTQFKSATDLELKAYLGGISAKLGSGKLSLSYGSSHADTSTTAQTRNKTLGLGGSLPLGDSLDLVLAHYRVSRSRTALADDGFQRSVAFLEYKLSKRSRVYTELDRSHWKAGYQLAAAKRNATGLSAGLVHTF
ncbi:Outer membrane protein (porin) [Rhodoferax sp. OV413]|uniref:porin n=1 Tax=Rhodoferax sp. OV413 TaxID=1855285 RepID=UPI00088643C8|nr:porin [Rhodoferax sp. OV413]SDO24159.1 Outer membrane protein (porin) [Rhodoferax sp. OV413]